MAARDLWGFALGRAVAPLTALGSRLRHARLFHPEGVVHRAIVVPLETGPRESDLAWRLAGEAIVRLSTAWWKHGREWPDVLGIAIRFRRSHEPSADAAPGDQDLLFATIRWPWTTPFAPLGTHVHDFLANDFHAVSPFDVEGYGRAKWRLRPREVRTRGTTREGKLEDAVERHRAVFVLEVRRQRPFAGWTRVAEVRLRERLALDQERLRFSPFREGRGIRPRGLVQAMRLAPYRSSQSARPDHARP